MLVYSYYLHFSIIVVVFLRKVRLSVLLSFPIQQETRRLEACGYSLLVLFYFHLIIKNTGTNDTFSKTATSNDAVRNIAVNMAARISALYLWQTRRTTLPMTRAESTTSTVSTIIVPSRPYI